MHRKGNAYYYVTRQHKWIPLGSDLAMAKVKWASLEGNQLGKFAGLAGKFLAECMSDLAASTQARYINMAKTLVQVFGEMPLASIKPHHIGTFLDSHHAKQSANGQVALMSSMFERAMRWGWADANPCRGVRRNKTNVRDRYLTDDEYNAVKGHVADWVACAMDISMLTGCRKADTVKVMLADITEDGLLIQQGKTKKRQLFMWSPELQEVIDRARSLDRPIKSFYLLGSKNGQPYSPRAIDSAFRRACKKLGIVNAQVRDIRAKAATDAKAQGQDYQALLGHSTRAMSDRYIKNRQADRVEPLRKKF